MIGGNLERWRPAVRRLPGMEPAGWRPGLPRVAADPWLILVVTTLCGLGLVMVYSASAALSYVGYGTPSHFFVRQALYMVLGLAALLVCARMDYHSWAGRVRLLQAGIVICLLAVLVPHVGVQALGARRWIHAGPIDIQPSVIAQLVVIIAGAVWLDRCGPEIRSLTRGLLPFVFRLVAVSALVLLEKDLGSTLIVAMIGTGLLVIAGARIAHLVGLLALGLGAGVLLILAAPYRVARALAFLHPFAHPLGSGFQAVQALYALGTGGLTGVGLSDSLQRAQWVPEAHTDFIFAIIGEQLGLLGSLLVLGLFLALAWRGLRVARQAPDRLGTLLAGGITVWLVGQAFINIGGVTDTIPSTGVPLTFVSYGGSSLVLSLAATGILLNISARGRRLGATIGARRDHRGRDRRPLHTGDRGGRGPAGD